MFLPLTLACFAIIGIGVAIVIDAEEQHTKQQMHEQNERRHTVTRKFINDAKNGSWT